MYIIVYTAPASSSGTYPPSTIFKVLEMKNAASMTRKIPATAMLAAKLHCQISRMAISSRAEVRISMIASACSNRRPSRAFSRLACTSSAAKGLRAADLGPRLAGVSAPRAPLSRCRRQSVRVDE